jgi:hypothetical protein
MAAISRRVTRTVYYAGAFDGMVDGVVGQRGINTDDDSEWRCLGGTSWVPAVAFVPYARVATTAVVVDPAAGAPLVVDGQTLVAGDRVWAHLQGDATGGMYVVDDPGTGADGQWSRAPDAPEGSSTSIYPGTKVFVAEGDENGQTYSVVTNTGPVIIGTTTPTFQQEGPIMRSDGESTEIKAASAFVSGAYVWSDALPLRDFRWFSIWFTATDTTGITSVDLAVQQLDDSIAQGDTTGMVSTDVDITQGTPDGTFDPFDYVAQFAPVQDKVYHLSFQVRGVRAFVGVKGDGNGGEFNILAMRGV